jgi:hypothetical protein
MRINLPAALFAASLALTACASSTETAPEPTESHATAPTTSGSPTGSAPASDAKVIEVTVKDGKVSPAGTTVRVKVGEPLTLRVTADSSGELHVHTDPAHSLEFKPGVSTLDLTIDRPGRVEVEVEETSTLVVNLEAR